MTNPIKLHNTLAGKLEDFKPLNEGQVKIYVCGITLYDDIHIGHLKNLVVFDAMRNFFESQGHEVTFVRNITDIDDKIIKKSKEQEVTPIDLVNRNIYQFHHILEKLGLRRDYIEPRVTEFIPEIISFINDLIKSNHAYIKDESVYFRVDEEKETYILSKQKLSELAKKQRTADFDKEKKSDFALWKKDTQHGYQSPWGMGRPGWHIECSVMHNSTLGKQFDIHGGGSDLIFPHHENEILQSIAHNHLIPAKYWIHNGMMTVSVKRFGKKIEEKMSKSLGNGVMVKNLIKDYSPEALKHFLLKSHYRSNQNFQFKEIDNSELMIKKFDMLLYILNKNSITQSIHAKDTLTEKVHNALANDFNTPEALSLIHQSISNGYNNLFEANSQAIYQNLQLLGVHPLYKSYEKHLEQVVINQQKIQSELKDLIDKRQDYRTNNQWTEADKIREQLSETGYLLMDFMGFSYLYHKKYMPVELNITKPNF